MKLMFFSIKFLLFVLVMPRTVAVSELGEFEKLSMEVIFPGSLKIIYSYIGF